MSELPRRALTPKVGVGALSSPLEVGADRAPAAAQALAAVLTEAGCEVVELGPLDTPAKATSAGRRLAEEHVDALALAVASWHEDYLALDLIEECPVPLVLWPLPGMETGALCGTQQLTCYLKQLAHPYRAVFGQADDAGCLRRAMSYLRAAALKGRLRRARVGSAGHRIGGMTHTAPNEFMLKKVIGPRVVPLDLTMMLERASQVPEAEALRLWRHLCAGAGACRASEQDGVRAMQVYAAVKDLVEESDLDALTIGCYPHLMGRVCLAASLLADQGVPLACEGDVHGAVAQLMLTLLTGRPTHNTDWLDPAGEHEVVFTHCGSGSFSLARDPAQIELAPVRLMDQGVCALFPARPGPVTLIGLLARPEGYQCALMEGEAVESEMVFPGNPLQVRFERSVGELVDWVFEEGIAHHWMAGYGHVAQEVRDWAGILGGGLRLLEPQSMG